MQNGEPKSLTQISKTAAQYGLVIGALLAIFSGGSKPIAEWIGMILGMAIFSVIFTVPVVWIKRILFKS